MLSGASVGPLIRLYNKVNATMYKDINEQQIVPF